MFFYLLSAVMLSRLFTLYRDERLTLSRLIIMMGIQFFLLLVFYSSFDLIMLIILLFVLDISGFWFERKLNHFNKIRFILFVLIFVLCVYFSSGYAGLSFNEEMIYDLEKIILLLNPFKKFQLSPLHMIIIFTGLIFLFNESNFFIRMIFEISGKIPFTKETLEPDQTELNAGRIIGILERIIIFFFIMIGQFAAVGFVIAAKGVVRYKELDNRNFAEYFLIGTLLSSLLAMFNGIIVSYLIS